MSTFIGDDVTVGHNAVIHACTLKNRAFVGISATVLDGAVIEEGGMLAAGGLLTPGKVIGPNELWTGSPAKAAPRDGRGRTQTFRSQCRGVSASWRNGFARGCGRSGEAPVRHPNVRVLWKRWMNP